jgi:hypothetical protein
VQKAFSRARSSPETPWHHLLVRYPWCCNLCYMMKCIRCATYGLSTDPKCLPPLRALIDTAVRRRPADVRPPQPARNLHHAGLMRLRLGPTPGHGRITQPAALSLLTKPCQQLPPTPRGARRDQRGCRVPATSGNAALPAPAGMLTAASSVLGCRHPPAGAGSPLAMARRLAQPAPQLDAGGLPAPPASLL